MFLDSINKLELNLIPSTDIRKQALMQFVNLEA